jgi:UDP-2,4-diacetamido-2,4,6-trideoxy-beta-L-altropyranose hydrolase
MPSEAAISARAPRVLFISDAAPEVGGGHVMRSLTLAGALAAQGWRCAFLAPPFTASLLDRFGAAVDRAPAADASPEALVEAARASGPHQAVLVDHFDMAAAHEERLRAVAPILAVVDDLADREHAADLLIDCNLGRTASDYAALTPAGAQLLLGPRHAPVRPEFAGARPAALARREHASGVARVLVALGLTDVGRVTAGVVRALLPVLGDRRLEVVTGETSGSLPELRAAAAIDPRLSLRVDARNMAALMSSADLAIGAGGSSNWERATVGLPTLTLVLAPNQVPGTRRLAEAGATEAVDWGQGAGASELAAAFQRLIEDHDARDELGRRAAALCDGEGARRTTARLTELQAGRS